MAIIAKNKSTKIVKKNVVRQRFLRRQLGNLYLRRDPAVKEWITKDLVEILRKNVGRKRRRPRIRSVRYIYHDAGAEESTTEEVSETAVAPVPAPAPAPAPAAPGPSASASDNGTFPDSESRHGSSYERKELPKVCEQCSVAGGVDTCRHTKALSLLPGPETDSNLGTVFLAYQYDHALIHTSPHLLVALVRPDHAPISQCSLTQSRLGRNGQDAYERPGWHTSSSRSHQEVISMIRGIYIRNPGELPRILCRMRSILCPVELLRSKTLPEVQRNLGASLCSKEQFGLSLPQSTPAIRQRLFSLTEEYQSDIYGSTYTPPKAAKVCAERAPEFSLFSHIKKHQTTTGTFWLITTKA
ncbi:hypothetical protein BJ508DRAFT_303216 [Ascobolus immersus RN42]|uniref:Uncharacterized protein n=1 Tax=Ascobolus immersus RN42 TaxID=1160509 RepID=A0A3N4IG95_ASCIM|nr:hypothetical protein BJ508DRAFT_303216 [Ascobolus immersus RN42]